MLEERKLLIYIIIIDIIQKSYKRHFNFRMTVLII